MDITIVGTGYVGLTAGVCLASKNHNIICIDIEKEKISKLQQGKSIIYEPGLQEKLTKALENKKIEFTTDYEKVYKTSKVIMICVPTPEDESGKANMKYINTAIEQIKNNIQDDCYIIIKSTVPVGTCKTIQKNMENEKNKIKIIFNPEFLSQGEAVKNFLNPQRIVIGVSDAESKKVMEEIYEDFNCRKLFMDTKSAEISKYACNNFLALKLTYINELANLCEKLKINVANVLDVMKSDNRIGEYYLEPGIGYGGSCLPKDTKALEALAKENNVQLTTIEATISANEKQRNKLLEKLDKYYEKKDDLSIAVLGLSFKENTNDLRESQAIENIKKLKGKVKKIKCYDNKNSTLEDCKRLFKEDNNIYYFNNIEETCKDTDVCMIFNKEKEILELSPTIFKANMKNNIVLDGKNCFDTEMMRRENIKYDSIGRKLE